MLKREIMNLDEQKTDRFILENMFREAADLPFSWCIDDHEIADFPIHEIYEME